MALNFEYGSVKDWETVCVDADGNVEAITERIIWGTMMTGLHEVKEENLDEWIIRITMLNKVQPGTLEVNLHDLQQRIGLRTNARPYTPAKFRKIIRPGEKLNLEREVAADGSIRGKAKVGEEVAVDAVLRPPGASRGG